MPDNIKRVFSLKNEGTKKLSASLISILIGFIFGGILLFITALFVDSINMSSAFDGFRVMLAGIFNTGKNEAGNLTFGINGKLIGDMLFRAIPLIMTGLSVSLAYKTGLFNIGTMGQYLIGTAACIVVALSIDTSVVPAWIAWLAAFLAAMCAGALWGCIPGIFKAFLNVNEVITCIMTNWIAANLVTMIFDGSSFINTVDNGKSGYTLKLSTNGVSTAKMGLDTFFGNNNVNAGIFIAIIAAIICWFIISKSVFGFELRACGSNKDAAKMAGMNEKRNIVLSMAIAGALAAAGAALYYLSGDVEFYWHTSMSLPDVAYNGIPVALLAGLNPIGCVFTGMFMSYLDISGSQLSNLTAFNEYNANIIIAAIVYLCAFAKFFSDMLGNRKKKTKTDANKSPQANEDIMSGEVQG